MSKNKQTNPQKATPMDGMPMKILALALAVLLVFGVVWSIVDNSGVLQRGTVTLKTEHYEVNNSMLSYYYQTEYANFVSQNSYLLQYIGLDTSKSLKVQNYSKDMTWFEYFLDSALKSVKEHVLLCEAALAAGKGIGEKEQKQVDEAVENIKSSAKLYKMSVDQYVSGIYGTGVKLNDVIKCLEISALASKQYNDTVDSYKWDEGDFNKWLEDEENMAKVWFVDYMSYEFEAEFKKDDDEQTKNEARAKAEKLAKQLAEMKTKDEFYDWIKKHEDSLKKDDDKKEEGESAGDASAASAETDKNEDKEDEKTEEEKKEEEEKKREEAIKKLTTEEFGYDTESDFGKWAFGADRAENETTVIYDKDEEIYTAYLLLKPKYRHEYASVNVRHILISVSSSATKEAKEEAKKKAEEILAEYKKGDATAQAFGELAKKYTDDGNGEEGGLYENVCKGDMVDSFNDWIYDATRKPGDTDIVETTYGYHVMFYEGTGMTAWHVTADNALNAKQYEEDLKTLEKTYTVEMDIKNAYKIDG